MVASRFESRCAWNRCFLSPSRFCAGTRRRGPCTRPAAAGACSPLVCSRAGRRCLALALRRRCSLSLRARAFAGAAITRRRRRSCAPRALAGSLRSGVWVLCWTGAPRRSRASRPRARMTSTRGRSRRSLTARRRCVVLWRGVGGGALRQGAACAFARPRAHSLPYPYRTVFMDARSAAYQRAADRVARTAVARAWGVGIGVAAVAA